MGRADKPDEALHGDAGDFLARWSQRKHEARRQGTETAEADADLPQDAAERDTTGANEPPARELTDADMPPLDSLTGDSDFSPFMSPGVSDGLRRLALRKLFSQPDFNITDGLNDYDEDYTQFAGLGNVITHEMKRMLQREHEKRERDAPPAAEPPHVDAALPDEEVPPEISAGQADSNGALEDAAGAVDEDDGQEETPP
jgi:hypothetical protein